MKFQALLIGLALVALSGCSLGHRSYGGEVTQVGDDKYQKELHVITWQSEPKCSAECRPQSFKK